jgi:signal transduction histidine kinase
VPGRERLLRLFAGEEVAAALRHRLVNKVAAVGALTFHLRRQLPSGTPEAATQVLPMIDAELAQASQLLDLRFLGPAATDAVADLGEVIERLLASLERRAGVELVGPPGPWPRAAVDGGELEVALFCLVENALEAARGKVVVRRGPAPEGMATIEVADDGPGLDEAERRQAREPFFTTRPGRLGVGLNVAGRIAQRWRGSLELADATPGLAARLSLPVAVP